MSNQWGPATPLFPFFGVPIIATLSAIMLVQFVYSHVLR